METVKITLLITLPTSIIYSHGYLGERMQESEIQGSGRIWELEEEGTDTLQRKEIQANTPLS